MGMAAGQSQVMRIALSDVEARELRVLAMDRGVQLQALLAQLVRRGLESERRQKGKEGKRP